MLRKVIFSTFFGLGLVILTSYYQIVLAQGNNRLRDDNRVGWYNYMGTVQLKGKWSLHTEYQWRRDDWITHWQQSLVRTGVNYQVHPRIQVRLGYAWIETFNYGSLPLNRYGKDFTEHRLYQMAILNDQVGRVELQHRLTLEQRWIGVYGDSTASKESDYVYANRARYMLRMQMPLGKEKMEDHTWYAAVYDEIFIGFGKNVNAAVFDQNRIGLLLGYRFNRDFRLEAGYLNQILQAGRYIEGKPLFQYNQGIIVNAFVTLRPFGND